MTVTNQARKVLVRVPKQSWVCYKPNIMILTDRDKPILLVLLDLSVAFDRDDTIDWFNYPWRHHAAEFYTTVSG